MPSLALGAFELTPLEIAQAYAVLASGGRRAATRSYLRVVDIDGRELATRRPEIVAAFDPAEVGLVTSARRGAVERGTGRGLRSAGYLGPVAGKTGTTNDFRDAWFVAYTPELVVAVWVGFDDARSLGLTGSRAALPICAEFLEAALGRRGGLDFPQPDGLERVDIHAATGLRSAFGCWGEPEVFLAGTAPRERCAPGWRVFSQNERDAGDVPRSKRKRRERGRGPGWLRVIDSVIDAIEDAIRENR